MKATFNLTRSLIIKVIFSFLLGIFVSYFGVSLVVKNSKPIYKTSLIIGTPLSLKFQEDYDMVTYVAAYKFNFERFLININDKIINESNPCNAVSIYKNRPSIIIVGRDHKINIEMISEDNNQIIKCTNFIKKYIDEYETNQLNFIKNVFEFKYGNISETQENDNLKNLDAIIKRLVGNFKDINSRVKKELNKNSITKKDSNNFSESLEYKLLEKSLESSLTFTILTLLDTTSTPSLPKISKKLNNINLIEIIDYRSELNEKYSKKLLYPSIFLIVFFISLILLNFNHIINLLKRVKLN